MEQTLQGRARFGAFELDPRAGELHKNGHGTVLQEQQLKVLLMLIERDGEIVTREEIKKQAVAERHRGRVRPQHQQRHQEAAASCWTTRPTIPSTSRRSRGAATG